MKSEIEAYYLDVEWLGPGRARRVVVSPDPLDIELSPDGVLKLETQIFHDFHPWLGLRLSGRLRHKSPVFVDSQGQEQPMLAVDDGAGDIWWVKNDGWDARKNKHLSELHRTMGRFDVRIGEHCLLIDNLATGLGQAQLEEYLQDFKNDLIWLVLSAGTATSSIAGATSGGGLPEALMEFASSAARVGSSPARILREVSAEMPRSRLRPNSASFRQYARQPDRPRLIGRASEESADTADNRYLRHMVQVCNRIALTAKQASVQQAERFAEFACLEEKRSVDYGATKTRQVDPEMFDRQIAELTEKLDRLAAWSDGDPDKDQENLQDFRIEITKKYGRRVDEFFYEKPEGRSAYDDKKGIKYNVVRLPETLSRLIVAVQNFSRLFTLTGMPSIKLKNSLNGKQYRYLEFSSVFAVDPDRRAIEAKLRTRMRLKGNGWQHTLSHSEQAEMRRESHTAMSRAQTYMRLAEEAMKSASDLESSLAALRQQDAHWHSLGVQPQSTFPMSMRYILSPDYAAVLKTYTRVQELADRAGISAQSLDELHQISILHASAIYERWCLVKIIGSLIEDFNFEPDSGWQDLVMKTVTGRADSACLLFNRKDIGIFVTLEIQPVLENGRRPDFRLRFKNSDSGHVDTIVMDAKFRTRWRQGELADLLVELVDGKGYGGIRDRVFILQPQGSAVSELSSPLAWGQHCDYGQVNPQNHRTGSIQLTAGERSGDARQNLHRLISIGLQAVFPKPAGTDEENNCKSTSCCIRCGTKHEPSDIELLQTRRGRDYWSQSCGNCGMITVRTHCYDCNATLFKNGVDLTYHRTLAEQITNVMCPSCGAYFDKDFLAAATSATE